MIDSRWIEENVDALNQALASRQMKEMVGPSLVEMIKQKRLLDQQIQEKRQRRNVLPEQIMAAKREKDNQKAEVLLQEAARIKEEIRTQEAEYKELSDALEEKLAHLPNIPLEDVPVGVNADDNVVVSTWGQIPTFDFEVKSHFQLGENLGMMDFERAAVLSGSRFVVLKSALAKLERALSQFMLDVHMQEFGYTLVSPPLLVNSESMFGTAQLPKFRDDQFQTQKDLWLIPTAEVPLTNLARNTIFEEKELPVRYVAYTPCFRLESGAAGQDTRGMLRQHQFSKVELVSIVKPEEGIQEHERLTRCAQSILEKLGLPHRTMLLCTGDMGFSAMKTYDLEVWLPFQKRFREISSCSLCGDFQARRMAARVRTPSGKLSFVHTLNGSGLAVGRTLIALLENYQQADGSILLPECLHALMGCQRIEV